MANLAEEKPKNNNKILAHRKKKEKTKRKEWILENYWVLPLGGHLPLKKAIKGMQTSHYL